MPQLNNRKFKISDAVLLAHVGKIKERLSGDLPTITAEFPFINEDFLNALVADHQKALDEGGDDMAKGEVGEKTQALLDAMSDSSRIVRRVRIWVGEAFGDDPARRRSFGLSRFWKVANNQPKLIKYMNGLKEVVANNRAALEAAGASAAFLDSVKANADALTQADAIQEASKGGRMSSTQARVLSLNSLYERAAKLDRVTDIVFEEDEAKASFYNLPQVTPKAEDMDEEPDDSLDSDEPTDSNS